MDDLIKRQDAIESMNSETVSTNPKHFKSSEKFIKFIDDSDIASFGEWQWANGFNTALVAARIQLEKLPFAQQWIPCSKRLPEKDGDYLVYGRWENISDDFYIQIIPFDTCVEEFGVWHEYFDRHTLGSLGSEFDKAEVKAWMPLPKPYKESEN